MLNKIIPTKPLLIVMYGFAGSGKTTFARQFCEEFGFVHLQSDKIVKELFDGKTGDEHKVMDYLATELLKSGISVVYDSSQSAKGKERKKLANLAKEHKAKSLTVWLQIDAESAFARTQARDRRKTDDKYAVQYSEDAFKQALALQQNPSSTEEYVVISGKHIFKSQQSAILKKLYDLNLVKPTEVTSRIAKPQMVNLVPHRSDFGRRNISIR